MKIEAAVVRPVRLRFARAVHTALGVFRDREVALLELRDADGVCGWGEAAPWPGFATERLADSLAALRDAAGRLAGAEVDPRDDSLGPGASGGQAPAAGAALRAALCDLAARRRRRPLRDELAATAARGTAGAPLDRVAVSALLVAREPDAIRVEAQRAGRAGHRAAKLKLGALPLALDVARVRAARDGLGPGIALRADANGAWSAAEALAALEALADAGLEYLEQPLRAGDLEGLARLRGRSPVRVALDESVASGADAARLIGSGLADVLVLKPAVLGGPLRALELAARARQAGLGVVFSQAFESAVGAHHALHCAAAWGDASAAHGLATAGLFERDVAEPVAASGGFAAIGDRPGLGIVP